MDEFRKSFDQLSSTHRIKRAVAQAKRVADVTIGELAGHLIHAPLRQPLLPCLLAHTATSPSVRICTLDPGVDLAKSKLLHDDGSLTISKSWPLEQVCLYHNG